MIMGVVSSNSELENDVLTLVEVPCRGGDGKMKFLGERCYGNVVILYYYHCNQHGTKTFTSRQLQDYIAKNERGN